MGSRKSLVYASMRAKLFIYKIFAEKLSIIEHSIQLEVRVLSLEGMLLTLKTILGLLSKIQIFLVR